MHSTGAELRRAFRRSVVLATLALGASMGGVQAQGAVEASAEAAARAVPGSAADAASAPAPAADASAASGPTAGASAAPAPVADASTASAPVVDARAARVEAVVEGLRKDPLLSGRHKERRLHWNADPAAAKTRPDDSLPQWLGALARFLNDASRLLLWGAAAVLVALLLVSARHLVHLRSLQRRGAAASALSHVRDLDVRPESLPDDVGAAAWALWQAGQVHAALSLLYRGALSRLIHTFRVPIAASSTEGECLDLARPRLDPAVLRYLTQVVRAREASIYGGRTLSAAMGEALCSGFAPRLDTAAPAAPERAA